MRDKFGLLLLCAVWGLVGCNSGETPPDPGRAEQLKLVIEPTVLVARQNESVVLRVDTPQAATSDLPAGYAFDLDEVVGRIDVTTTPCPQGSGTPACQDWTITPRSDSVPGNYDVRVQTVGSRAGTDQSSFTLRVVLNPAPAYGAAVAVRGDLGNILVLNDAGQVFAQGRNNVAQVHMGYRRLLFDASATVSGQIVPETVTEFAPAPLPAGRWIALGGDSGTPVAIREDGTAWLWGAYPYFDFGPGRPGRAVEAALPLPGLAGVRSWSSGFGSDDLVLLEDGRVLRVGSAPTPEPFCESRSNDATCEREASSVVAMSTVHGRRWDDVDVLFLKADGTVWQVRLNENASQLTGIPAAKAVAMTARKDALILGVDGTVWLRPEGSNSATAVAGLSDVVALSTGPRPTEPDVYALRVEGTVWTWEVDAPGEKGTPRQVAALTNVVALGDSYAITGDCGTAGGALWALDETSAERIPGFGEGPGCTAPPTGDVFISSVTGAGRVVSEPAAIDCGSTCRAAFPLTSRVLLHAAPAPGWRFDGWDGAGPGAPGCFRFGAFPSQGVFVETTPARCEVKFVRGGERRLEVDIDGGGVVTSTPAGIDCGSDCSQSYEIDTDVLLTAAPAPGYRFDSYSGDADCSDGSLTMIEVRSCTAQFAPLPTPDAPAGLAAVPAVTSVRLSWNAVDGPVVRYRLERADASGMFARITSDLPGSAAQFVDSNAAPATTYTYRLTAINFSGESAPATVSATTLPLTNGLALSVAVAGAGGGSVTSSPSGISCPAACTAEFAAGTVVTLSVSPSPDFRFDGWTAASDPDCSDGQVTMDRERFCEARFESDVTLFSLIFDPNEIGGPGHIVTDDLRIDCPDGTCAAEYPAGTLVRILAVPDTGAGLEAWRGDCAQFPPRLELTITMESDLVCGAVFASGAPPTMRTLTIHLAGDGQGVITVDPQPPGTSACSKNDVGSVLCDYPFVPGTTVQLQITVYSGFTFGGWNGCDSISGDICTVTVNSNRSVGALIDEAP